MMPYGCWLHGLATGAQRRGSQKKTNKMCIKRVIEDFEDSHRFSLAVKEYARIMNIIQIDNI